jgi:hypothetical protein
MPESRAELLARAVEIRDEHRTNRNTAMRVGGALYEMVTAMNLADRFDVTAYGADVTGVDDSSEAFEDAAAAAVAAGGIMYIPAGQFNVPEFVHPSGLVVEGVGDESILLNCHWYAAGTAGEEIAFTAPAAKGATSISIPATGLTGSWLRVSSCINMQSPDAGRDQLGHDASAHGYLSEFVRVKTGNAGTADLQGGLTYAYSNTPGADTYAPFTTSVARVVTFHESGRVRKLKFLGKNAAENQNIELEWCRGFIVEDCTVDSDDATSQLVRGLYCFDCHVIGGTMVGKKTSVPAGSTANPIMWLTSQGCTAQHVTVHYGNQGIDNDAISNDTTYRGGPCIACGAIGCYFYDQASDGFTSHWGCQFSFFDECTVMGAPRGGRIRDRNGSAHDCRLIGASGAGIGILLDNAAVIDGTAHYNVVVGYLEGVQFHHSAPGYEDLQVLMGGSLCDIAHNQLIDQGDHAVYCTDAPTSATMVGPAIHHNLCRNPAGHAVLVNEYNNGTRVFENTFVGIASAAAGVSWGENIKRLHIGTNYHFDVHASGFALKGAGVSTFMTDATTFPGGEAEAELFIAPQMAPDAAVAFSGILRDNDAYVQPQVAGWQPFVAGIGDTAPTLERSSLGIYQDSTSLKLLSKDSAGTSRTYTLGPTGVRRYITTYDGRTQSGSSTTAKRTGLVDVECILIGGGGPGGSGCKGPAGSNRTGGSGGGSGARTTCTIPADAFTGANITVKCAGIGTGGISVSANGTVGNPGTAAANNTTQVLDGASVLASASSGTAGLAGALASTSVSGQAGGVGEFAGATGGNGTNVAGGAGGSGVGSPGAGGGGGGLDTGNTERAGGNGGVARFVSTATAPAGGTAPGGVGTVGTSFTSSWGAGFGGAGGGSSASGNAGAGGAGGDFGGGGGGGGAAQDSVGNSGAGGDGGPGLVVVIQNVEEALGVS